MDKKNIEKAKLEWKKCKDDPVYFITKYIWVQHPIRGLVRFELYPFQKHIVNEIHSHRFNILRKFRQAGCTTIAMGYALWMIVFYNRKTVAVLSKGDVESTEFLERVVTAYEELPTWMRKGMPIKEKNKHSFKLKNNSVIKCRASGKESGRSLAASLLIVDEAAFIETIKTIWAAAYPVISTGGAAFVLSTVNGVGNWFYEKYRKAKEGTVREGEYDVGFNPIDIRWVEHPEYKRQPGYDWLYKEMLNYEKPIDIDKWEETAKANLTPREWRQEYLCEFLGTGDTFIDGDILIQLKEGVSEEYYQKYNRRMRVWQDPHPEYDYVLAADCSLGRMRDYSAFHIINTYNGQQVAEFYSRVTSLNDFAKIIAREASKYNTAYTFIESNSYGLNVIDNLYTKYEYENIWADDNGKMGFLVTQKNRDMILGLMEEAVRSGGIKINSERTIDELMTFIFNEQGKAVADEGQHDDLVMSLAIASFGLETLFNTTPLESQRGEKEELLPIIVSGPTYNKTRIHSHGGMIEEDISWILK